MAAPETTSVGIFRKTKEPIAMVLGAARRADWTRRAEASAKAIYVPRLRPVIPAQHAFEKFALATGLIVPKEPRLIFWSTPTK